MGIEYIAREPPAQVQKGGRFDPEGSNRQSNFRLFLERKNYVVQTRMRLAKGLISLKPTSFSQPIDDAQRRFHALALCIVNDSRTIPTSMHARGNPTRSGTRKLRSFREQFDQRLLSSFWDGEYIDLSNNLGVCMDRWHVQLLVC
jgi:hypothetical protein